MNRDDHIEKGRASLIPECCIAWWIEHDCNDFSYEQNAAPTNYVPCPSCAAERRFVPIHLCDQQAQLRDEPCGECGYRQGADRAFVRQPSDASVFWSRAEADAYYSALPIEQRADASETPTPNEVEK